MIPLLPGLMKNADDSDTDAEMGAPAASGAGPLTELLDLLDDSQLQELQTLAAEYVEANPEEEAPAEEEPVEGELEETEGDAPPEGEAIEEGEEGEPAEDEEPSAADLAAVSGQIDSDAEEAADLIKQLEEIAGGDDDSAPDAGKLLKMAGLFVDKITKCQTLAAKAVAKEDAQTTAQAGVDARDYLEATQHLVNAARALTSRTAVPAMTPQDHPAIAVWAERMARPKPVA